MASYTNNHVTNSGLNIFARADSGEFQVEFTRVVTSSQDISGLATTEIEALTDLENIQQSKQPDAITVDTDPNNNSPIIYVRALITNGALTTSYTIHTCGLYAKNPDDATGETDILVVVSGNADDSPIVFPAASTGALIGFDPKIAIPIARTASIDFTVDPSGSVTQEDLERLKNLLIGTNYPNKVWINPENNTEVQNGSASFPYKTIDAALVARTGNSRTEFLIAPGEYTISTDFDNMQNIYLHGIGAIGGQIVTISGDINIPDTASNIGISDIEFTESLTINSSAGNIFIDNCRYESFTTGTLTSGNIIVERSFFENSVSLYGNPKILFRNCDFGSTGILFMRNTGMTVEVNDCARCALNHQVGRFISTGNTRFKQYGAGYAIYSTASGLGNELILHSGSTAQDDGTYAKIEILNPDIYYVISKFDHASDLDSNPDSIVGNRVRLGLQVADLVDDNTYTGFENTTGYLKETLRLFDLALVSSNETLNQVLNTVLDIQATVNNINSNVANLVTRFSSGMVRSVMRLTVGGNNGTTSASFASVAKVAVVNGGTERYCTVGGGLNAVVSGFVTGGLITSISTTSVAFQGGNFGTTGSNPNKTNFSLIEFV